MPTLLDHRGEPVDLSALEEEHATPSVGGVRSPVPDSVADTLSPKNLATLLSAANEGDVESYLILAEEIEERDSHYRSVLNTRKLSVSGAPASVETGEESSDAKEKAEAVRRDILEHPAFRDLVFDLVDGIAKGYSIVETIWDTTGSEWKPKAWKWRDPRFFVWDLETLQFLRLITLKEQVEGEELPPFKFLTHSPKLKSGMPMRGGLARPAAFGYMVKGYTVSDWLRFIEVFGTPIRVGKITGESGATKKDIDNFKKVLKNIGVDSYGVLPQGWDIELEQAGNLSGGQALFQNATEWVDRQTSKLILGQTMTTEDGSSRAQAEVHQDTFLQLTRADCWQVSATINRDLVRPYIDLNFGEQEVYPRIKIKPHEPEDQEKKARTVSVLVKSGLKVPAKWAYDEFGIPEPEDDDAEVLASAPASEPQQPPQDGAQNRALQHRVEELERALNARGDDKDEIDRIAEEALRETWEPQLSGTVGRVIEMAQNAGDYEEFRALLNDNPETFQISEATEQIGIAVLKARGIGDVSDDPNGV